MLKLAKLPQFVKKVFFSLLAMGRREFLRHRAFPQRLLASSSPRYKLMLISHKMLSTVTRIYKGRAFLKGNSQCIKFFFFWRIN